MKNIYFVTEYIIVKTNTKVFEKENILEKQLLTDYIPYYNYYGE